MATPSIPRTTATKSRTPSTVRRIDVSPQVMERERTGRYKQLKSSAKAFIDTRLPNGEREILTVIGRGVIEDADLAPPIKDNRDFNVAPIRAACIGRKKRWPKPKSTAWCCATVI